LRLACCLDPPSDPPVLLVVARVKIADDRRRARRWQM